MNKAVFPALFALLLVAGCTPSEDSSLPPEIFLENVVSGDSVVLYDGQQGRHYEISLVCIKAVGGEEGRQILENNLKSGTVSFVPVGQMPTVRNATTYKGTAEVFVDLGDGPQSVNEAQLLAGMAIVRTNLAPHECPFLEVMKQAQQEAKESRAGVWRNAK